MQQCLEELLPRLLPGRSVGTDFLLIPHEGKQALEKSIPIKVRGWHVDGDEFVVVRDQDSGDCVEIKNKLVRLCREAGREPLLVRIACREMESWFLGELAAVEQALGVGKLAKLQSKKKYKAPDEQGSPNRELKVLIPGYSKTRGARKIGACLSLDPEANASVSYRAFVTGVVRAAEIVWPS